MFAIIKNWRYLVLGPLIALASIPAASANADVGLPPAQPGSSLSPRDMETNVQMVSEDLRITITREPDHALVEASFQMRNNGAEDERIEVWFPLGETRPESKAWQVIQVKGFQAWVDQEEIEVVIDDSDEWNYIWAHWPVSFPARATLSIQVSYLLDPDLYGPPGWFHRYVYFLETGAGWQGVIEEAAITIEAPYPLQEMEDFLGGTPFYAWPKGYTLDGSALKWVLRDIEPTGADQIDFRFLDPAIWYAIKESPQKLLENPDDWAAHYELARGLMLWIAARRSAASSELAEPAPEMGELTEIAANSYLKTLELSPPDRGRTIGALDFLVDHPELVEPAILQAQINRALALFPENDQIQGIYQDALAAGIYQERAAPTSPPPTAPPPTESSLTDPGEEKLGLGPAPLVLGLAFILWAVLMIVYAARRIRKVREAG